MSSRSSTALCADILLTMATSRSRVDPESLESEAADLLAGRRKPQVQRVLELIRAINPTSRTVHGRREIELYELKSRLQSLLIRHFPDELRLEPPASPGGAYGLRHRYSSIDGCHLVIAELDEDARSWARIQIDTGAVEEAVGSGASPHAGGRSKATPDRQDKADLLSAAQAALDEYDYEQAERLFRMALERSGGSPEAALPLLELLVDTLARDADALLLSEALAPAAIRTPSIRLLLAIAASRVEDARLATAWVRDSDAPRAAEVHVFLARSAWKSSDRNAAEAELRAARTLDPNVPGLVDVERDLAAARRDERAAAEHALEQAASMEASDREAQARQLLERWPESVVARRIVRELEVAKRRERVRWLDATAAQELTSNPTRAAFLWREAQVLEEDESRAVRIAEADAAARRLQETAAEEEVTKSLEAGDLTTGLEKYLTLEPGSRTRVRKQAIRTEALDWLDRLARSAGRPQQRAAVDAVLALRRAADALAAGRVEPAMALMESHAQLLHAFPPAEEIFAQARRVTHERRAATARGALERAREAWAHADSLAARRALDGCDAALLSDLERAVRAELDAAVRTVEAFRSSAARVAAAEAEGDLFEARHQAAVAVGLAPAEARAAWIARHEELAGKVRSAWQLQVFEVNRPLSAFEELDTGSVSLDYGNFWLTDEGRRLVLLRAAARTVLLFDVDVASSTVRRLLSLRTPFEVDEVTHQVWNTSVFIIPRGGDVLEMNLDSAELLRWIRPNRILPAGALVNHALIPDGRTLWLDWQDSAQIEKKAVVDLDRVAKTRELGHGYSSPLLASGEPARVCLTDYNDRKIACDSRGHAIDTPALKWPGRLHAFFPGPLPAQDLIVGSAGESDEDAAGVAIVLLGPGGVLARVELSLSESDLQQAASLTAHDVLAVAWRFPKGEGEGALALFEVRKDGFMELAQHPLPPDVTLAACPTGPGACLLTAGRDGWSCYPLLRTLPALADEAFEHASLPSADWFACAGSSVPAALQTQLGETLRGIFGPRRVLRTLELWGEHEESERAHERRVDPIAHGPVHVFEFAKIEMSRGRWTQALEALEEVPLNRLPPAQAAHTRHLLGICLLYTGDFDRARALLRLAETAGCNVAEWLLLADPWSGGDFGPEQPGLQQLKGILQAVDAHLKRDELAAALPLLRRRIVYASRELQSLARLAHTWQNVEPADALERVRRDFAIGLFLEAMEQTHTTHELPLGERRYPRAQLLAMSMASKHALTPP